MNTVTVAEQGPRPSGRAELTRAAGRARMFLISYVPLFGILAIRFNGQELRWSCVGLAVVGLADLAQMTLRTPKDSAEYAIEITSVEDTGGEIAGYLASYLLPFVTVASPTPRDIVAYGAYLLVALVIFVRSDLIRVNPTFYLFCYKVVKVGFDQAGQQYLLTRVQPEVGERICVVDIAGIVMKTRNDATTDP